MQTSSFPEPAALDDLDRYWRAANYLSVGQVYLLDNPLLKTPLTLAHVKPRLLGHWGTVPGLNFIYVHLNRVIRRYDVPVLYVAGPGHGGPAMVANAYLEGTYSEVYPHVTQDADGMRRLFKQFSFPGGIPSHVAPETPGSIHEGGELGYSLSHAFGAAFDNPDLLVACVVGDGEAETGPLATSWHSNKFLHPGRDGAVLPILHLNGYKIAGPTVLARLPREELAALMTGYGYEPFFVEGEEPAAMHRLMAATLDTVVERIRAIQARARTDGATARPRWPMVVLRTPKGWSGPRTVDGLASEGTWRAHQVPIAQLEQPGHLALLEQWPVAAAVAPAGAGGRAPHGRPAQRERRRAAGRAGTAGAGALRGARGGARCIARRSHARAGAVLARSHARQPAQFPRLQSGRDHLQPVGRRARGHLALPAGRDASGRRAGGAGRARDGDVERTPVPGLARGLPAHGPARHVFVLRGLYPHRRFHVQPARQMAECG
jgi:hypothetical protein